MLSHRRRLALIGALLLAGFALGACQTGFFSAVDDRTFRDNSD